MWLKTSCSQLDVPVVHVRQGGGKGRKLVSCCHTYMTKKKPKCLSDLDTHLMLLRKLFYRKKMEKKPPSSILNSCDGKIFSEKSYYHPDDPNYQLYGFAVIFFLLIENSSSGAQTRLLEHLV